VFNQLYEFKDETFYRITLFKQTRASCQFQVLIKISLSTNKASLLKSSTFNQSRENSTEDLIDFQSI